MTTTKKLALYSTVAILGLGVTAAQAEMNTSAAPSLDAGVSVEAMENKAEAKVEADVKADAETNTDMKFTAVDENADGEISETEFSNAVDADTSAASFSTLDADKNGSLNKTEFDVMAEMATEAKSKTKSAM